MTSQPTWRVIATELRCSALCGGPAVRYTSPAHSEPDARRLIAVLAGASDGQGPWRRPIAGGRCTITLEPTR